MYLTGTTCHLTTAEAVRLAGMIKPEGGKCILRTNPLGTIDLISLSPKPLYPGQTEFVERRSDIAA